MHYEFVAMHCMISAYLSMSYVLFFNPMHVATLKIEWTMFLFEYYLSTLYVNWSF